MAEAAPELPWRGGGPSPSFPWRILAKAGEGAMGEVYLAEDPELGRRVAIKVMRPDLLSGLPAADARAALQRFVQEARAAAALSHPGVPAIHRVGTEGGWPFIVMEWLDGPTLEQALGGRRLPPPQAAWLGLQILSVLEAAHGAGIVHRDIKPGNLVVTRDRRVKLTDFGIAHVHGSALARTQAGAILGTPQYAAPEQLAGRPVDGRADLYAVGAVLYQALCGRPPFEAATVYELIHRVQSESPPAPGALVPGLPPAWDALLSRALAKRAEDRFANAREMAAALAPLATPAAAAPVRAAPEPTLASVPVARLSGSTPQALVASLVRQWPATPLGRRPVAPLLDQLAERPLHAPAFSGALELPGAVLLYYDGVLYGAFDPSGGPCGDAVVDALAPEAEATLRAAPSSLDPRAITLLASLSRGAGGDWLDGAVTDLPRLAGKLSADGFDGALRLARGPALGFALFSKGTRLLDLLGDGWPDAGRERWERWIGTSGARARVEPREVDFPSLSFRQQLAECALDIVRPAAPAGGALRSDAVAEAQALRLQPRGPSLHRSGSMLDALVGGDPAQAAARWLLAELPIQFDQFGRTARWRKLVEPLASAREIRLHHALLGPGARGFDAAAFDGAGRATHLLDRVAAGSREAVEAFAARARAAKSGPAPALGGAVLFAPRFDDEALDAYLRALRGAGRSLRGVLSHREGFVRTSAADGFHLLLVEEDGGRRRPLVPE